MRVRDKRTGAQGFSDRFNTHGLGEVIVGFDGEGGMDSEFIGDYDVQLHTGDWVPLSDAFRARLVVADNYNTCFREPRDLGEMERGWF